MAISHALYSRKIGTSIHVSTVRPLVDYGLAEARVTSDRHAMTEVALIAYLMVESWEMDESFPGE